MIDAIIAPLRLVARRPTAQLGIVISIALGVGASTAIFSVIDATLLRGAPFPNGERLAEVWSHDPAGDFSIASVPARTVPEWASAGVFEKVAEYRLREVLVIADGEPRLVNSLRTTHELLPLLGARVRHGRGLTAADTAVGAPDVALLSEDVWRRRFGARRDAVGETVAIDGRPHTVIGVLPRSLRFPVGVVDVWLALKQPLAPATRPENTNLLALVRPGLTRDVAGQRAHAVAGRLKQAGLSTSASAKLVYVDARFVNRDVQRAMWVLACAVACLLLVACINAAHLQLSRMQDRGHEIAIRGALGADRSRLVIFLLGEAVAASVAGGLLGILCAFWGVDALIAIVPRELSVYSYHEIAVNVRVLAFAVALSVFSGVAFGLWPALRGTRAAERLSLLERSSTSSRSAKTGRAVLIVAQMAFSTLLLIGAGLFLSSFLSLNNLDPGFHPGGVLAVRVEAPRARYATAAARDDYFRRIEEQLRRLPGVNAVSMSATLPPRVGVAFPRGLEAEGGEARTMKNTPVIPMVVADTAFFSLLRLPLTFGRGFTSEDRAGGLEVAIVDRDLANLIWPGVPSPVGRRFRLSADAPWLTLVGVAERANLAGATVAHSRYGYYRPVSQEPNWTNRDIAIRVSGGESRLVNSVRDAIRSVDPLQPIDRLEPLSNGLAATLAKPRFLMILTAVFALVGLTLAVVGVFAVVNHTVARRGRELGIRIALGAAPAEIKMSVLAPGLALTALGAGAGVGGSLLARKAVAGVLYGFSPTHPGTIATVVLVLLAASALGMFIPARRATRVDPRVALAAE